MAYIKLFKEMWRYAGADRWKIVLFMSFHALSLIQTILQPLVFAQILNVLQTNPDHLLRHVMFWIGIWIALFFWFNTFHRSARYFEFDLAYRIKQRFLNEYYGTATQLSLQWHSDHHSGETINRIDKSADALQRFTEAQQEYIAYFMLFWGPLFGLAVLSWEVSAISLVVAIATVLLIKRFDAQLAILYGTMNDLQHRIAAVLYDYIGNMKTVITLRLSKQTAREFDHRIELGYKPYMKAEASVNAGKWFSVSFCVLLLEAGVILFYIWRRLGAGRNHSRRQHLGCVSIPSATEQHLFNIARKYQEIINWWVDYQTILPLKDALSRKQINQHEASAIWNHVNVRALDFDYAPDKQTLRDISLSFSPGDPVALVGESRVGQIFADGGVARLVRTSSREAGHRRPAFRQPGLTPPGAGPFALEQRVASAKDL